MSARFPYNPYARSDRPDVLPPEMNSGARKSFNFLKILKYAAASVATVTGLSGVMFVPVLVSEVGNIDAVMMAGELLPAYSFADRLLDLFMGTVIVSLAILSFLAAAALSAGKDTDPFPQPVEPEKRTVISEAEGSLPPAHKVKYV